MRNPSNQYPDLETLTGILNATLDLHGSNSDQLSILSRRSNPLASTYPSEIVECQLADGSELRLFCKYTTGLSHESHGHRGNVEYEAEVYRQVLAPLPVSAPTFYGLHRDAASDRLCLILKYFDKSVRVTDSRDPALVQAAARWLGEFHRASESRLSPAALPFLNRHDAAYYLGWAERTSFLADHLHLRFPWLAALCTRFRDFVDTLLQPPAIVIHGEYYPDNLLFDRGTIYPVDWESAAVALAEIDLASLIEGWPKRTVSVGKAEYLSARWPDGPPADFEHKLAAAKLYWNFRWLGERRDWTHQKKQLDRFAQLNILGERFGLI